MTLFNRIKIFLYRTVKLRVWFASITVIILFLLLALTVNSAREKDIVRMFGMQQLANVQNYATRMADIFLHIEKNINLFSRFYPHLKLSSEEINGYYKVLSSGWEKTLDAIVLFDSRGNIKSIYPRNSLPAVNFYEQFNVLKKKQKQYLGMVMPKPSHTINLKRKADRYLVLGYPIKNKEGKFEGAWIISFFLPAVVEKYQKIISQNTWAELLLMDENNQIIIHLDSAMIGKKIKDILSGVKETEIDFSSESGGYVESVVLKSNKKEQRSIISYYPLKAGETKWTLLVIAPYSEVISPLRKTFVYTLFSSLLLILVVIVGSITFAYKEGKRLHIKETNKRLKEREDWQERLLREKKTIDGIIEGSPIPSFVINKEHKVILWNRACTELTGYSAEDMVGTDRQYVPFYSNKRPVIADLIIDNEIEDLSKYYGTKRIKKSDMILGAYEATDFFENLGGRNRFLYFLAAPIYNEKGEIIAAIETLQDISREKEMTNSLNEYAETLQNELIENIELRRRIEDLYNYLQSIINSLPDKIYEMDENGIIKFMSRGLKKKGESSSREFKDKHFLEFVASGYENVVLSKWEEAKKGSYKPYEIEAIGKDGRKHNLLITTSPVMGTNHYILVQRDITEFKNLEKKLYDSQKLAALGQLSAGIAHEIRNPLSSIKMSLQILAKRMNPEGNDLKRFKIAEKEVDHLEMLVNNILAFAKPVDPKKTPMDLSKVLEQAIAMSEKGITDKKIEIQTNFSDVPPVSVDAAMMADAFLNVIRNAIEAVAEHGKITISLRYAYETRRSVVVEIKDNGSGIDQEDMPHIFNPFFTRKKYGTGLGLSLVKKIVDIHQGAVDILSKKNEGTKVLIILPLGTESTRSPAMNNK
ncbi:MAG: PAS domain S-box protein [Syntrophaceae bacterium]|nr:PAS domain S-box protein [Syntrophaceae bacterium]